LDTWPGVRWSAKERLGGYRVVLVRSKTNPVLHFRPHETLDQVTETARAQGVPCGEPLWIVSTAWHEDTPLASRLPAGKDRDFKEFGRISVIRTAPM